MTPKRKRPPSKPRRKSTPKPKATPSTSPTFDAPPFLGLSASKTTVDLETFDLSPGSIGMVRRQPPTPGAVPLTAEEKTILETLLQEHPMLVGQAGFEVGAPNTVRKYVTQLRNRELIHQPRGDKKGWGLTSKGLELVNSWR